jgi:hypothetical protein
MQFKVRKLPKSRAAGLTSFSTDQAEPFKPLHAPIYVLLHKNEKLVPIKAPLDFLDAKEIEKLAAGGSYFFGPIYERVKPFLEAADEIKKSIAWSSASTTGVLEPAPYEISDSIIRKLAGLWAPLADGAIGIETYFAVAFTNELCESLPETEIEGIRDSDPDTYELTVLRSGLFVFLALHLGHTDLRVLNQLRLRFFNECFGDLNPSASAPTSICISLELHELKRWIESFITSPETNLVSSEQFSQSPSRVAQKLESRLLRLRSGLVDSEAILASTAGEDGLGEVNDE